MEDAVEVTQVELRTMGIGPKRRLQVLARLKGEDKSRLLFEEHTGDSGEIGHCAHVSGIRNAKFDPLSEEYDGIDPQGVHAGQF